MAIKFGLFYDFLVYFVATWNFLYVIKYIFPRFGMLYEEKSGNPDFERNSYRDKVCT
jgi:hypothetical protein